jgi:lysophospholipase L1-like esterase
MNRWIVDHIGLSKPYRFERTLVVLVALVLAIATGAAAATDWFTGKLTNGTIHGGYFIYLAFLVALALGSARRSWTAALVLSLATLELGLGVGSTVLRRSGVVMGDLLTRSGELQVQRVWHPLLQVVVQPGAVRRVEGGEIRYNSLGKRGPERSPAELRGKSVIALFGGSTTEDIAMADGHTWADQLERLLGAHRFAVINHGASWYSTAQILLQTAFYGEAFGVQPDCAIYYVGGVDVQNSHMRGLDPSYANYHTPALIDAYRGRRVDWEIASISPLLRYVGRLTVLAFDTPRPAPQPSGIKSRGSDPPLEAIYAQNIRTISAINRQRGIKTIWSGEIIDPVTMASRGTAADPWAPFVNEEELWALLSNLNEILRREAIALGDFYVAVPVTEFAPGDFIDAEHFATTGSLKFASHIARNIAKICAK